MAATVDAAPLDHGPVHDRNGTGGLPVSQAHWARPLTPAPDPAPGAAAAAAAAAAGGSAGPLSHHRPPQCLKNRGEGTFCARPMLYKHDCFSFKKLFTFKYTSCLALIISI